MKILINKIKALLNGYVGNRTKYIAIESWDINRLLLAAERYEKIRILNPRQFRELWDIALKGNVSFDDLVDDLKDI